jgi:hypothetical protein
MTLLSLTRMLLWKFHVSNSNKLIINDNKSVQGTYHPTRQTFEMLLIGFDVKIGWH